MEAKVRSLALSPDGKLLASSSADGLVQLWDTARGRLRGEPIRFEAREIRLAFSADGKILGTLPIGGTSERLQLRDPSNGRELELLAAEPDSTARCFAFAPDGRALVTAGGPVTIWGLGEDQAFRTLRGRTGLVRAIAYSPDGATIAAAGGDGSVPLWDAAVGASLARLEGHTASVLCVAFSPDGKTLASGAGDLTIRLWDVGGRSERAALRGPIKPVTALAFTRDGKTLASASDGDPTIWLWDAADGRPAATLTLPDAAADEGFACLAFSPDGKTLYTGGERGIAAWDVSPTSKVLERQAAKTR